MLSSCQRFLLNFSIFIILTSCTPPAPVPIATATPSPVPVQGAEGIGDPYYPDLGNGGYDVQHYTITLNVDPPTNAIDGSTSIAANATETLSAFNLDFHELTVDSVTVNDTESEYSRKDDELTIKPAQTLLANQPFTVVVSYHGLPKKVKIRAGFFEMGWSNPRRGAINVWGEPDAAATWFPNNNHPRDKASYRFEITVPKPWMVAASGTLKETKDDDNKTTFIWDMDKPMASYLASISIDQYDLVTQNGPHGIKIRSYFPTDFPASQRIGFNMLPALIDFYEGLFGPYPFDEYGVVIAEELGFCNTSPTALEAQSMSIHCPDTFMTSETVIAHELAHQWFGDSVSLENWKDVWLKEGFATYAEWLWDSKNEPSALARIAQAQQTSFVDDASVSVAEPTKMDIYTNESYTGGALVLHALHIQVGDETFFKIMQTYAERYRYGVAGTDEFIAVANEVTGEDLASFFNAWLFSKKMPDLPE